jgi:hypothetical protein
VHPEFRLSDADNYSHLISGATEVMEEDWTQMMDDAPIVGSAHGRDDESSDDSDSEQSNSDISHEEGVSAALLAATPISLNTTKAVPVVAQLTKKENIKKPNTKKQMGFFYSSIV